ILAKNISPDSSETKLSMIVATPKARLVKLALHAEEDDHVNIGGSVHKATHLVGRIEVGGLEGVVAPMIGKRPPDFHIWVLKSEVPAFLKSETQFYQNGPIWRIELTSPIWPPNEKK